MSNEEMITIRKSEYDYLNKRDSWLCCLEEAGVDNWEGYSFALDLKYEREEDIE